MLTEAQDMELTVFFAVNSLGTAKQQFSEGEKKKKE